MPDSSFQESINRAIAECEKLSDRSVPWQPKPDDTPYMSALRAAIAVGPSTLWGVVHISALDDMYSDCMTSRHPHDNNHLGRLRAML